MNTIARLRTPVSESDHVQGDKNAPITLVEYGDYQCPYCGKAHIVIQRLKAAIGKDLRFVFRQFPLVVQHPDAMTAAAAAEAAGLQGKFWEMHALLYENQEALDSESLLKYASNLNLDLEQFKIDVQSDRVIKKIERDLYGGSHSGVNGTPGFFINGYRYDGDWSFSIFSARLMEMRRKLAA